MHGFSQITIPIVIAFIITVIASPVVIPILRKIKAKQSIREEGPKSHMSKSGTPTMGGIIIIAAVIITCVTSGELKRDMLILIVSFGAFGALGFIDDFVKVSMKRNLGLTPWQKLIMQLVIAASLAVYQAEVSAFGTAVYIPFADVYFELGKFYIPFIAFVVVAIVNSVNLTDGLDGLASGVTMIVALLLAIIGASFGYGSSTIFSSAMVGACLGFLIFNKHPAKVFMGDTGSLALGGGISAAAILMNMELIIPIAGMVYVLEAGSVVLQVASYKLRGKRIFRMAPLHHHFELGGWKETKVVAVFWIFTFVMCMISALIIF